MPINLGSTEIVDRYIGDKLIEKVYLGSNEIFNAYTTISDNLPILYNTRAQYPLKDYTVYGTTEGSGVETENLYNEEAKNTDNGYMNNRTLQSSGSTQINSNYEISEYFSVSPSTTYVWHFGTVGETDLSVPSICWYDSEYNVIGGNSINKKRDIVFTTTSDTAYVRLTHYKALPKWSTYVIRAEQASAITKLPYGYQIAITNTGEDSQTANYNIYIGNSKLSEEEYIDYSEQKIYKRTEITDVIPYSQTQNTSISGSDGVYRIKKGTGIVTYECVKLTPSISGNVTFKCKVNITTITTYGLRVCFRNSTNQVIASSDPVLHQTGESFAFVTMTNVPAGSVVCFLYNGQGATPSSETFDFTISDMALYIDPQDPPVPFPQITAYLGDNILSSTQTLGNTSITYRINNNNIITDNLPIIYTGRTNNNLKDYIIYGSSIGSGVATSTGEPEGYYIPITNTNNNSTIDNYNLYIGTTKLTNEEYISYKEQKIYKMIDNVLTPIDPPSPFPPIQTYIGENIITSNELLGQVTIKDTIDDILDKPIIYGYHIDPTNSNPNSSVIYLKDAIGKNPASMGSTTFDYGDWENAFFMPKPCMVKYNGTVDYYLDENDYNYKAEDGLISTNNLPLNYKSRTETILNNYTIYGTSEGVGTETENLFNKNNFEGFRPSSLSRENQWYVSNSGAVIRVSCKPSTSYTIRCIDYSTSALWRISVINSNVSPTNAGVAVTDIVKQSSNGGNTTFQTLADSEYILIQMVDYETYPDFLERLMVIESSTSPDHYIPYGYQIQLADSGENSQSEIYPLYIGNTQLGEEECLDYAEQKVYKRTSNLFNKDDKGFGYNDGYYLTNSSPYTAQNSNWAISAYIPVAQGVTYVVWWSMYETISAAAPSVAFYKAQLSSTRISVTRYENRGHFLITAPSGAKYARISFYKANEDFTTFAPSDTMITEPIPYLQPTDPPVSFPSITTYEGQNTLSSTETLGNVSISNVMVPSDISNQAYDGNAMIEWPKIYYKFEEGNIEGEGYFYCSNKKVDSSYECYCNIDSNNNEIDHFYTAIYNGTSVLDYSNASTYKIDDYTIYNGSQYKALVNQTAPAAYSADATYAVGDLCTYSSKRYECNTAIETAEAWTAAHWTEIPNSSTWDINNWTLITNTPVTNMRSLSGVRTAPINGNGSTSGSTEVTRATANNTTASVEWYIDTLADRMLINGLLILISKSLNSQAKFGQGITLGSQAGKEAYITGTLDDKGMFYGNTSGTTTAVKVFGMENWWGLVWHRTAGLIGGSSNRFLYKLTYNTYDGSTATSYNSNGTGYLTATNKAGNNLVRPSTNNYVNKCNYGKYGYLPIGTGSPASASACYCDYYYNGTGSLLVGGYSYNAAVAGCSSFSLHYSFALSYWTVAGALSLKPLGTVN